MFSRALVVFLAAATVLATPHARFNGLTVSLSSSDVSSITDLKVDATVSNTGTEAVKILKVSHVL